MNIPLNLLYLILFPCLIFFNFQAIGQKFAITHVNVVDVINGKIIADQTVLVEGSKISWIKPSMNAKLSNETKEINGTGKYLMPGLTDTHLHIGMFAHAQPQKLMLALKLLLANGVTGLRDAGANGGLKEMLAVRDSINAGMLTAPKLYVSAVASKQYLERFRAPSLSSLVDTFHNWKVDGIKIKRVTLKQTEEIVDAAKRHHLPVYGHTYNHWENETDNVLGDFTAEAIEYGIDGVMHSNGSIPYDKKIIPPTPEAVFTENTPKWEEWWLYVDKLWLYTTEQDEEQYIKSLLIHKVWLEPTLSVESIPCRYEKLLKADALKYLLEDASPDSIYGGAWFPAPTGTQKDSACLALKKKLQFVKKFADAGGTLLAGTDGLLYGYNLWDELYNFRQAGLSNAAILKIVTYNNAVALGWSKEYGTIERGKIASMVLLNANPLKDIRNVEKINSVFVNGKYLTKKMLNKFHDEAKAISQQLHEEK